LFDTYIISKNGLKIGKNQYIFDEFGYKEKAVESRPLSSL